MSLKFPGDVTLCLFLQHPWYSNGYSCFLSPAWLDTVALCLGLLIVRRRQKHLPWWNECATLRSSLGASQTDFWIFALVPIGNYSQYSSNYKDDVPFALLLRNIVYSFLILFKYIFLDLLFANKHLKCSQMFCSTFYCISDILYTGTHNAYASWPVYEAGTGIILMKLNICVHRASTWQSGFYCWHLRSIAIVFIFCASHWVDLTMIPIDHLKTYPTSSSRRVSQYALLSSQWSN